MPLWSKPCQEPRALLVSALVATVGATAALALPLSNTEVRRQIRHNESNGDTVAVSVHDPQVVVIDAEAADVGVDQDGHTIVAHIDCAVDPRGSMTVMSCNELRLAA